MIIVNPLYDNAFKYLMQHDKAARLVLSTILEQEVVELQLEQQEVMAIDVKRDFMLFRLDFKATIEDENGVRHKVLIELQKSKFSTDIQRFRNYLASGYLEAQRTAREASRDNDGLLPIIAIYILGYALPEVPHLAIKVQRQVIDSVSKKELHIESDFINLLTHETYVLQALRLPEERRTRLERFMMFFNQRWVSGHNYYLDMEEIPEEFEEIANILHFPVADQQFRTQLEAEEELDRIFDEQARKYEMKIKEALQEKEEAVQEKEAALQREADVRNRLQATAKIMKQARISVDEITQHPGLDRDIVEAL